jgi:pilus assembly protein CpaD
MSMSDAMRAAAIAAVLIAGSCAAPSNNNAMLTDDPVQNHPIVVDTAPKSVRLGFSAADAGLMPDDATRFDAFVSQYKADGTGAISVTAPAGPVAQQANALPPLEFRARASWWARAMTAIGGSN